MLFKRRSTAAKPVQSTELVKHPKLVRDPTARASATRANATNPLLLLPNELSLTIVERLLPLDQILFSYTCSRLRALLQLHADRENRDAVDAMVGAEALKYDDNQETLGSEWAICYECNQAHTRDAFFPEQLARPSRQRGCKRSGVIYVPDGGCFTYYQIKETMGTPDTARKQWLSRGNINPVCRTSQELGKLDWVSWRICRDTITVTAPSRLYSPSVNYAVGSRLPSSRGPFRGWRRKNRWECMLKVIYAYSKITSEEVHAHMAGDMDLRKQRRKHTPEHICPHLLSTSETVLQLSASISLDRATGQCKDCCTTLELKVHADALYLVVDRDIGRIDVDDPLKNEKWLAHASMPPSKPHAGRTSAAALNPSKYEATRHGVSQAVSGTLNRPQRSTTATG